MLRTNAYLVYKFHFGVGKVDVEKLHPEWKIYRHVADLDKTEAQTDTKTDIVINLYCNGQHNMALQVIRLVVKMNKNHLRQKNILVFQGWGDYKKVTGQ
ncbi:MAG: hypothetical protein K9L30_09530 [Desulfobacterales bacterium]|nr:hypothetical protein [Desulfobacterales bacterium]